MAYCKAHQLDMQGFCGRFDCPCIKHNCRFFGVKTNADRIRAMSDEELAEFLGEYRFCDICDEGCEACTYHGDCNKRLLDWLKQPAEE